MNAAETRTDALYAHGVLNAAEWHGSEAVARLAGDLEELSRLTVALTMRAVRLGHVCLDLARVEEQGLVDADGMSVDIMLPGPDAWIAALHGSPLVRQRGASLDTPLIVEDHRVYLDRYWRHEQRLAESVLAAVQPMHDRDPAAVAAVADRLFGDDPRSVDQRRAATMAANQRLTVLTGGPGTGKTSTVVRILALLAATAPGPRPPRMVLAAPTGKAAARMAEAVRTDVATVDVDTTSAAVVAAVEAATLHRLLGASLTRSTRFRHDATNPLPYDVVVVDEASMVSLPLMTRLIAALGDTARLVLVGDRDQLASIDAGAVLADIAAGDAIREAHVHLSHPFRFAHGSGIDDTARAIGAGDGGQVVALLDGRSDDVLRVDPGTDGLHTLAWERMCKHAEQVAFMAREGAEPADVLRAVDAFRVLAPLRRGSAGVDALNARVAAVLERSGPRSMAAVRAERAGMALGTPIIVTRNDHAQQLYNGDVGVVVPSSRPGGHAVAFWRADGHVRLLAPARLPPFEPVHAMSVHRSQGSQFDEVVLVLPSVETPLLSRELIYTAVTRARRSVMIVGTATILMHAVSRRVQRASGLRRRLATSL